MAQRVSARPNRCNVENQRCLGADLNGRDDLYDLSRANEGRLAAVDF